MPADGRVLLDTNIIIALFAGETPVVAAVTAAEAVFVSAVTLGELYYGARYSGRPAENLARIDAFATAVVALSCDAQTASVYGEVKAELRARGTPIPENDVWISALARQHELTLVTRDAHFEHVAGLAVVRWT